MVHRLLSAAVAVAALACLATAGAADAANTRVSLSGFAWSQTLVRIDLGESVTWDWIGPDLAHSVTAAPPGDPGWDSDAGRSVPAHRAGDSFSLRFEQAGTFPFQCKLHPSVRGEVVVSPTPGDPSSDPGPQAPLRASAARPTLGEVRLRRPRFRGRRGTKLVASVSQPGKVDAEYFLLRGEGRRSYRGFHLWPAFIGINRFSLGARGKRFAAAPGRYEVVLRAVNRAGKASRPVVKRFAIL